MYFVYQYSRRSKNQTNFRMHLQMSNRFILHYSSIIADLLFIYFMLFYAVSKNIFPIHWQPALRGSIKRVLKNQSKLFPMTVCYGLSSDNISFQSCLSLQPTHQNCVQKKKINCFLFLFTQWKMKLCNSFMCQRVCLQDDIFQLLHFIWMT